MKNYLIILAMISTLAACSADDSTPLPETKDITLHLSMVEQINTTRRPIYSQEALQQIGRMNLYVFQQNGNDYLYKTSYNIPWTLNNNTGYYTLSSPLSTGSYKFIVTGQETTDDYALIPLTLNTTKFDDFGVTIDHTNGKKENEIFSGYQNVNITGEGTRVDVSLTRQVAGVMSYLKNVPKTVNGTAVRYLRLTVSNANTSLNLTTATGSVPSNSSYIIYQVDLSTQATNDSVFLGNTIGGVTKLDFTQLNGAFLLPVNNITMTLGLYDTNGVELKTWPVKNAGATTFNIAANRLYTLGRKLVAASTDGGNPSNPNNNDSPIDLLQDIQIAVTINPNWDVIYTLPLQ